MNNKINRNDPCPCGSGNKYKKCCLNITSEKIDTQFKAQYRFEPGSYGDTGNYMPSIACLKSEQSETWAYHFVLVNPSHVNIDEDDTVAQAEMHLSNAFEVKGQGGTDAALAMELKSKGYISVDDFNIVDDNKHQA